MTYTILTLLAALIPSILLTRNMLRLRPGVLSRDTGLGSSFLLLGLGGATFTMAAFQAMNQVSSGFGPWNDIVVLEDFTPFGWHHLQDMAWSFSGFFYNLVFYADAMLENTAQIAAQPVDLPLFGPVATWIPIASLPGLFLGGFFLRRAMKARRARLHEAWLDSSETNVIDKVMATQIADHPSPLPAPDPKAVALFVLNSILTIAGAAGFVLVLLPVLFSIGLVAIVILSVIACLLMLSYALGGAPGARRR